MVDSNFRFARTTALAALDRRPEDLPMAHHGLRLRPTSSAAITAAGRTAYLESTI